jgi:hypothetical protein
MTETGQSTPHILDLHLSRQSHAWLLEISSPLSSSATMREWAMVTAFSLKTPPRGQHGQDRAVTESGAAGRRCIPTGRDVQALMMHKQTESCGN